MSLEYALYRGRVSAMVVELEAELKYYKHAAKEQEAIIKQLHRGYVMPGEVTYIHPYDLAEIINKIKITNILFSSPGSLTDDTIIIDNVRFKQSPFMPQITKNIS